MRLLYAAGIAAGAVVMLGGFIKYFVSTIQYKKELYELLGAKKKAEQENISKNQFLSQISCEIRSPMNAIIGMTNIGKTSRETDRKDFCFEKIETATKNLLGMINNVMDISKIEADELELTFTSFSLDKMLAKIIAAINGIIEDKRQRLVVSANQDAPDIIYSDERRLTSIILNMLGNAVKYTPEGGAIFLFVSRSAINGVMPAVRFEIKDTGIGISEERIASLFTPYSAPGAGAVKYGGLGLGLVVSKRLIEMMGGGITVKSAVGKGTSFIFEILTDPARKNNDNASLRHFFPGMRILVAEDNEENREAIRRSLETAGVAADFAENGRKAYDMFLNASGGYDAIFMDTNMPEINGYDAAGMIRGANSPGALKVPIVAMTSGVFREDIDKCVEAGMNDYIGKPLVEAEFMEKLGIYYVRENVINNII